MTTKNIKVNAVTTNPTRRARGPKQINHVVFTAPYYGKEILWEVYPDNWPVAEAPLLGYVRADSEYWARYAAMDAGLVPYNASFAPKVVPTKNKALFTNKAADVRTLSAYK